MKKDKKAQVIKDFVEVFGASGFYLLDFKGLNVEEVTELRTKLRQANVSMRVVKNTLAKRALNEVGITDEALMDFFVGPTSIIWSKEDAIAPVKVLTEFLKSHEKATLKAGMLDRVVVNDADFVRLAKMPSKHELQAQLAMVLNAPIVKLARVLNAMPEKLARTVDALQKKKEEEEKAA